MWGTQEAPTVEGALEKLIERLEPELVIASGDLTHVAGRSNMRQPRRSCAHWVSPCSAIPGNHDIPYTFPARFTRTFDEFERHWETTEPVFSSETLYVIGLNSVRAWRHQSGGIRKEQLQRASKLLAEAPQTRCAWSTMHHQMIGAPWRSRKKPVARRSQSRPRSSTPVRN